MRRIILLTFLILLLFPPRWCPAVFIPLDIDAINQENLDYIGAIVNTNLVYLWITKLDNTSAVQNIPVFYVSNLSDPGQAEYNAWVINKNFEDLWINKTAAAGGQGYRAFTVHSLNNPEMLESNLIAINRNLEDLFNGLADR